MRLLEHKLGLKPDNVTSHEVVDMVPIKRKIALVAKAFIYPLRVIEDTTGGSSLY